MGPLLHKNIRRLAILLGMVLVLLGLILSL
jgi:hypothetical protein